MREVCSRDVGGLEASQVGTTGRSLHSWIFHSTVVTFHRGQCFDPNHAPYGQKNTSKMRTVDTRIYGVCDYANINSVGFARVPRAYSGRYTCIRRASPYSSL
jgi:hypothetical protein